MKKSIIGIATLITACNLSACQQPSGPDKLICAYINDSVTKVDITHHIRGTSTQWTAVGQDVNHLREWACALKYERFNFEAGQSPGDVDGGEVYDFILTEGDDPGFTYVINGLDKCYLLIEGDWYSVSNPSDPPVTEP